MAVVDHPAIPKEAADRVNPMLLLILGLTFNLGRAEVAEVTYMEVADAMVDAAADTVAVVAVAEAVDTEAAEARNSLAASLEGPLESLRQNK